MKWDECLSRGIVKESRVDDELRDKLLGVLNE